VIDDEVSQHTDADVDAADQAGGQQRDQRPLEAVAALGDEPVECLLDGRLPRPVTGSGRALFFIGRP
jgi:hypothetical protein